MKSTSKDSTRWISILAMFALLVVACGGQADDGAGQDGTAPPDDETQTEAADETTEPMEMTQVAFSEVIHSIFYAPQYVGMTQGFFEEVGLDVSLSTANGGDKLTAGLLGGHADIGLGGPETAILVNVNPESETELRIVGNLTNSDGTFLVCREAPEGTFDWASLDGKEIIGWRPASTPQLVLEHVLKKNDAFADVTIETGLDPATAPQAFSQGQGDCITVFEPVTSILEAQGGHVLAALAEELGSVPYTAYLVNSNFLDDNPDVVERWLTAVKMAKEWVTEHEASEVAEAVQPHFPDSDVSDLTSAIARYKEIGIWSPEIQPTEEGFGRLVDLLTEGGLLEAEVSYDEVVTTGLIDE